MPLPYWVGHFNMRITNRLMNRLAPRLPGFGVIIHTGRESQRTYHTAVNVFRRDVGFVIALAYGRKADWVRNVLASGSCKLVTRGKVWRLTNPQIYHDESRAIAQGPVHLIFSVLQISDFLVLTPAEPHATKEEGNFGHSKDDEGRRRARWRSDDLRRE
jgi:deazaflavin-dependent oxidoreductase (nitroreductase family)